MSRPLLDVDSVDTDGYGLAADCDILFSCLDRPRPCQTTHIASRPADHHLRRKENAFIFSMAAANSTSSSPWSPHRLASPTPEPTSST